MSKVLVLAYHRVHPGHHTDPDTFEWQIKKLKEKFIPLTLEKVVAFAKGELRLEKDGFAITFDDGWADNFLYAYPILKKLGVPATIFAPTSFVNRHLTQPRKPFTGGYRAAFREIVEHGYSEEFLTWEEIKAMEPLVAIESHGHRHINHSASMPKESEDDLKRSLEIIKKETATTPRYLAWPFGEYSADAVRTAKSVGIGACFTMRPGRVSQGDDRYELKRFAPPRTRALFRLAISGSVGMTAYRTILSLSQLTRR